MTSGRVTSQAIELEEAAERLRQARETFDHRKVQDQRWFNLKLAMGWSAVVLLPAIFVVCVIIIFRHDSFSEFTVTTASGGLLADILAIVAAVWRVVFSSPAPEPVNPVRTMPKGRKSTRTAAGE